MNKIINISNRGPWEPGTIEEEARSWVIQLDSGWPAGEELSEFHEWLSRSAYHQKAFKHAASTWNNMDLLSRVLDYELAETGTQRPPAGTTSSLFSLRKQPALKAIMGLTVIVAAFYYIPGHIREAAFSEEYKTAIGEQKSVILPDGSNVQMNTNSKMDVLYEHDARIINFPEGEAWFDVSHNPEKPFVVYAGGFAVRAVGTAFAVHVKDGSLDVTVTEGRVEVVSLKEVTTAPGRIPEPEEINLAEFRVPVVVGQHMVFDYNHGKSRDKIELVQELQPDQIERRLSWREGILVFDDDTLEEVVTEINRYTPVKLVITEAALKEVRFGGYFQASDIDSILSTLESSFNIHSEKINSNLIHLSRR